ncbi:MAG: small-conductance mechanosensitive channel [Myxococcota bacterium]|jgi:small-conductance mechanosensitive channel
MGELWGWASGWLADDRFWAASRSLVVLIVGLLVAKLVAAALARAVLKRSTAQQAMIVQRVVRSTLVVLVLIAALRNLGFDLSVLVGAAGVLTVAIGFASQTSASNLISGAFLMGEQPFVVGDVIRIGTTTGAVISVDLMSVKLRTYDNLLVRLPNETLLKSEITNLSHFPVRRLDLPIAVSYRADITHVRTLLEDVASANPLCLDEPAPLFIFLGFGQSSLDIQFSVWATKENFLPLRNAIYAEIKQAFDSQGIEIPFPQRTLSVAAGTEVSSLLGALGDEPTAAAKAAADKGGTA